ncbi:MAG: O-antigen ligase family protein [Coprobacillus sp.]
MKVLNEMLGNRKYFKLLFIVYVFTNTLALGYYGIDFNPLSIIVFGYGIIILIHDLIKKELFYSKNHMLLIMLYGVLLCVGTYMNKDYSNKNSFVIAGMQILIFLLIFGQKKSMSLKQLKKELMSIIPLTCMLEGIASLVSLGMYFLNISGAQNGWYIGLVGDRLFGIYFNCNPASFLAIIVILLSLIAVKNHYKGRMLYIINIGVQLSYIVLTQCRAAIIILAVIMTAVLYYYFFRAKEISKLKAICLNIGMCICILFGTVVINEVAFIIPEAQGAKEEAGGRFQIEKINEIVSLIASRELQNIPKIINLVDDISSGRITLSKQSVQIWQKTPLHGIGAGNFRNMLLDISESPQSVGTQILHSHNVFLETLVTGGVFGFLVFFLFFIKTLFITRDVLIKYKNKKSYLIVLLFIMIFVSEFIGGMLDFGVFYVYSLSATLAWMFLGYVYWLNNQVDVSLVDDASVSLFNRYELMSIEYTKENIDEIKPEFVIIGSQYNQEDYVIDVKYIVGHSSFVYRLYYTMYNKDTHKELIDEKLVKEFYNTVKDDVENIYNQSNMN